MSKTIMIWKDILEIGPQCQEKFVDAQHRPEILDVDIELAGVSSLSGTYQVGRTNPSSHTLFYTVSGQGGVNTPQGRFALSAGSLAILPKSEPFIVEILDQSWSIVWFNLLDTQRWRRFFIERDSVTQVNCAQQLHHTLSLVYCERSEALRQPALNMVVQYLQSSLTTNNSDLREEDSRLERLFMAVENQLHSQWTVANMCQRVHYSAPHFYRLCMAKFGRSPLQQVIYMRVERAKYLLKFTNWPISQIANLVGYQDVFIFSKRFKKSTGASPTRFRQQ